MRKPERKLMASNPVVQTGDSQALEYEAYRNDVEDVEVDEWFNDFVGGGDDSEIVAPAIPDEAVTQETVVKDPVSFNPIETGVPRAVDAVMSFVKDIGKGALETPRQALSGVAEGVNEMLQLAEDVGEKLIDVGLPSSFLQVTKDGKFDVKLLSPEETTQAREAGNIELFQLPEGTDPESVTGNLVRETSKFLFGFLPAVRGVKAIKGTQAAGTTFGEASVASAIASAVVQDPHEDRAMAYLNTVPGLSAIVPDYLADNDPANESAWEGRMKNAIEDAGIGVFAEGLFRVFKFYKAQRKTKKLAEAESDPMDRATLKEQARESAEQQADEVPAGDLSGLGDPLSKETFISADVANKRLQQAEGRVGEAVGIPDPEGKIFINMAKIDTVEDIQQLIQDVANADAKAINKKRGGAKKTLDKMMEESDQEFIDLKDLIGRDPGPMTAAEALAARKVLASSGDQLAALARRANSSDATPADLYAFRRGMSVHYAIQSEVIAARTETARSLRSWAIPIGTDKQRGEAIAELVATGGGSKSTKEMAQAIADAADNPTGLNKMVNEFSVATAKKAAFQIWMDGILSGPTTQLVNILGNSITAAYAIPESLVNSAISKIFYEGEVSALEATAKSYGMVKGLRDGFRMLAHGQKAGEFKELEAQFEQFVKFEGVGENNISAEAFGLTNSGAFGQGIDYLGKFFNISAQGINVKGIPVYPGLNTMDKLFKSMGYRMELEALAIRQGVSEGLEGDALAARALEIVNNPPPGLVADSIEAGHIQTFTNAFGETGKAGMQFLRRIPGGRLVVTFVRTPTNIMKYTFKRTPLALLARSVRADIAAGGARGAQAWGRIGLGSMIMLGMADMTLDGTITGPGPQDPRLRSNLMLTGWRPFSVKIGGDYFPYNRLDPVGNLFAYGASMGEIINNLDEPDAEFGVATGVMGFTQNLASKSYLSGIFDFMAAIDPSNPVKGPEQWVQRFSSSLIPKSALLRSIARSIDPKIRITGTAQGVPGIETGTDLFMQETLNQMRSNVPFFSSTLPARVDLWGDDISRASHLGTAFDLLSPIYASEGKYDAVEEILVNNKIPIGHISKDIQGVKLTGQEQHDYAVMAGKPLKEFLNKLVKSPGFKALTDGPEGGKSNVIQDHVRRFRGNARNEMIRNNLSLQNRIQMKGAKKRMNLLVGSTPVADPTPGPAQLPSVEGERPTQSIEAILGGR